MSNDVIKLTLKPKRCLYPKVFNPKNDFYIYSCETDSNEVEKHHRYGTFAIKGKMQRLDLDVEYNAEITFAETHEIHGTSYNVISIFQEMPKTSEAQKDYFRALITENQLNEIYKIYQGEDIIELFKTNQFDFKKIKGFGEVTYHRVRQKILENLDYQELFSSLGRYGVTYDTIVKLVKEFGSAQIAIQKVKNNPYTLTKVRGIGFKKADAVARNMAKEEIELLLNENKITKEEANDLYAEKVFNSPFRIQSGIIHIIEQEQGNGNTYITKDDLVKNGIELLQIEGQLIINQISETEGLYVDENRVALQSTYDTENYIANWLKERLKSSKELEFNVEDFIQRMEEKHKIKLSDQQKSFFYNVKKHNVHLLVGYAGTGKSKMQSLLKELLRELGLTSKWLAPTGNAAKILSGYIGERASTAHKAIGYGQQKEDKDLIELHEDYIIIDETSMLDVFIDYSILKKIANPEARVLFIGDDFQIPSVAAGLVLHDMIESKIIPMTKLDIVFRQSEGGILDIATKVRLGQKFIENEDSGRKVYGNNMVIHCVDQDWMVDGYKHYYQKFLEKHKPEEIMVLSPTKKGNLGTVTINKVIQQMVNPSDGFRKEAEFGEDGVLRVGDYVINIKNTYDIKNVSKEVTEIVNGDKGVVYDLITDWKPEKKKREDIEDEKDVDLNGIYVHFDSDDINIPLADKFQLLHAWCLTMHKSQGGSAKAVLIVADKSHKWQMNANLLYTAITRAIDYVVIVCQPEVLNSAMRKIENLRRDTFLCELLKGETV